ncbi:MAG: hemolysin D [marine bacterium B5-7]|nr:MAG: hemolysin D [marine bacterium B5-7]
MTHAVHFNVIVMNNVRVMIVLLLCLVIFGLFNDVQAQSIDNGSKDVGFLEPYRRVQLGFPESGVIGIMKVREGQQINEGEELASLDNRVLNAAIAIAKAQSDSTVDIRLAEITLADRRDRLSQLEKLHRNGNARMDEVTKAALDVSVAEAELDAARHRHSISQLEYRHILAKRGQRRIVSPLKGVVIRVDKHVGETVDITDDPIIEVVQLDILKLRLQVAQAHTHGIKRTSKVALTIAGVNSPVTAVVEYISPVMDPRSATVEVHMVIDNRQGQYRSGQRAMVQLN